MARNTSLSHLLRPINVHTNLVDCRLTANLTAVITDRYKFTEVSLQLMITRLRHEIEDEALKLANQLKRVFYVNTRKRR